MLSRKLFGAFFLYAASCGMWGGVASATVNIDLVPVGNPGNANDPNGTFSWIGSGHYGAVNYAYSIGKYDVTVGQYTAFLNAVATTSDPKNLYKYKMGGGDPTYGCGIDQTYNSLTHTFSYTVTKNPNFPVNYVTFWDACRFTNWMQNNQPTGTESVGTTENGAYDLTNPAALANNTVTRSSGTTWAVASENEWYKAAYYDPNKNGLGSAGYWLYPTRSDSAPSNLLSTTSTNNANFRAYYTGYTDPSNFLTPVGSFTASPSAYGTFDQGGDVWQMNDTIDVEFYRSMRGGAYLSDYGQLNSGYHAHNDLVYNDSHIGFRVSQVPEPASITLLALGVIGVLVRQRRAVK